MAYNQTNIQGVPEKNAHSFAHNKFWTTRRRIALFASKCSAKTAVYQSAISFQLDSILFNSGRSSARGISPEDQEHWPSETSPEQLLGDDQPRTNQWCHWPLVWTIVTGRSFSRRTHWASFPLILWRLLVANFISGKTLHWKWRRHCCISVVHLSVAIYYKIIFNCSISTVSLFILPVNFWAPWWKPHDSVTHDCKVMV